MTLASHARGPEFEPRCEYSIFFCRDKKIFRSGGESNTHQTFSTRIKPYPHASNIPSFALFFLIKEALDMLRTFIWFDHGEWKPKEWECRIQVFSKLVESAQNTPWDPFVTQATPTTLPNPHFRPKQEPPVDKIGQKDNQQKIISPPTQFHFFL